MPITPVLRLLRPLPFSLISLISLALCGAVAVTSVLFPDTFISIIKQGSRSFLEHYSFLILIGCSLFLLLCILIVLSPVGNITLGKPGEKPEFSRLSWWSMLFAAGMGAGLLFWGVAEPLIHFATPPDEALFQKEGRRDLALIITYLHWALHPWAIYAIGALSIAYFSFRKGYPMLPSTPFRAMLPPGNLREIIAAIVDIIAIIAVVFGIAAALTQGIFQIDAGVSRLMQVKTGQMLMLTAIVTLIALTYMVSAATKLERGIRYLSLFNMALALGLGGFLLFYGPTGYILGLLPETISDYLQHLPSFSLTPIGETTLPKGKQPWSQSWTITYFLSWIAWVPFVGIFIARISRGRSIREFLLGVVLIPSLFTFLWFAIFGGSAIYSDIYHGTGLRFIVQENVSEALFALLGGLPAAPFFWAIATLLVFIFLVTSADSGSYVLGMISSNGTENPGKPKKLFWGFIIALLTLGTVFSGDSIHSVRAVFAFGAIPFFFIMLAQTGLLLGALWRSRHIPLSPKSRDHKLK